MSDEAMKDEFIAWCKTRDVNPQKLKGTGQFIGAEVQSAWMGWQSAISQQPAQPIEHEKTYAEMVLECNELARRFYSDQGYKAPNGFKFYESGHPQERLMWRLAVSAYEHIGRTDMDDILNMFLEGE